MDEEKQKTDSQSMEEILVEFKKGNSAADSTNADQVSIDNIAGNSEPIVRLEGNGSDPDPVVRKAVDDLNKCLLSLRKANEAMAKRLDAQNAQNEIFSNVLKKAASTSEVKSLSERITEEMNKIDESLKNYRVNQAVQKSDDHEKTILELYAKTLRSYLLRKANDGKFQNFALSPGEIEFVRTYTKSNFQDYEKASGAANFNIAETMALWNRPPDAFGTIVDINASEYSEVWKLASQWVSDNDTVKIDRKHYKPDVYWIGEVGPIPTDSAKMAGTVTLKASQLGVVFTIDRASLSDSGYDLLGIITKGYAERMAEKMEEGFWSGTQPYEPSGILTNSEIPSYPNGEVETITNFNVFRTMPTAIKDIYSKSNSQAFFMNRNTWGVISLITDGVGKYILDYNKDREGWRINGYPVIQVHSLPDIAANSTPIVFGDINKSYMVVRQNGKKLFLTDQVTLMEQLKIRYMFTDTMGGGVYNPEPLIKMKIATS